MSMQNGTERPDDGGTVARHGSCYAIGGHHVRRRVAYDFTPIHSLLHTSASFCCMPRPSVLNTPTTNKPQISPLALKPYSNIVHR